MPSGWLCVTVACPLGVLHDFVQRVVGEPDGADSHRLGVLVVFSDQLVPRRYGMSHIVANQPPGRQARMAIPSV
jgi:hypothetical protein